MPHIEGDLRAPEGARFAIIASRWNPRITDALVASARVLLHAAKDRTAPFVVVSIKLDDGPVVRSLLAQDRADRLPIGTRMQGLLAEVGRADDGETVADLRFAPVQPA